MKIGSHDLDERPLIVAEIGNNHEGHGAVARELVDAAAAAGADAVKFQALDPRQLVRRRDAARFAQLERFALSREQFGQLAEQARRHGIQFIVTPLSATGPAPAAWDVCRT